MSTPSRRFGPKAEGHPNIGKPCPACQEPFAVGDFTALVMLGPGPDAEERRKAFDGLAYNAVAVEVHWTCATGEPA